MAKAKSTKMGRARARQKPAKKSRKLSGRVPGPEVRKAIEAEIDIEMRAQGMVPMRELKDVPVRAEIERDYFSKVPWVGSTVESVLPGSVKFAQAAAENVRKLATVDATLSPDSPTNHADTAKHVEAVCGWADAVLRAIGSIVPLPAFGDDSVAAAFDHESPQELPPTASHEPPDGVEPLQVISPEQLDQVLAVRRVSSKAKFFLGPLPPHLFDGSRRQDLLLLLRVARSELAHGIRGQDDPTEWDQLQRILTSVRMAVATYAMDVAAWVSERVGAFRSAVIPQCTIASSGGELRLTLAGSSRTVQLPASLDMLVVKLLRGQQETMLRNSKQKIVQLVPELSSFIRSLPSGVSALNRATYFLDSAVVDRASITEVE